MPDNTETTDPVGALPTGTASTPGSGDGEVVIEIPGTGEEEMPVPAESWSDRLLADRDRHSTNATTLEKMLELGYASTVQFRDATASRIVLEAGSGRTRAETNNPGNTAAPGGPP